MAKVRLGIIGFGKMGSQHTRALLKEEVPQAELRGIADCEPKQLEAARALCGDTVQYFDSGDALIASGSVDAVIITTPHYFHPVFGIKGLKAGLHVMVEKPAGVYTSQVEELNEVARNTDRVFAVMFNQRTNPVYQKAHDLIASGELGEIKRTNWIITNWYRAQGYYDQGGWRATWAGEGGGVLLNQNPHNLDLWQWLCGMPSKVKSIVYYGKHRNIEVEDDVTAFFEYPNGATGTYITTIADTPGTNRLEITGDNGKLVIEDGVLSFWRLREREPEFNKRFKGGIGQPENWKCEIPVKGTYTSHCGILRNFCDAILTGAPLIVPGEEGIKGLEISNAIHLSSWLGEQWVTLPIDKELFHKKLQEKAGKDV